MVIKVRNFFFLMCVIVFFREMKAQTFKKGDIIINANYGAPNFEVFNHKRLDFNPDKSHGYFPPPLFSFSNKGVYSIKAEYSLNDKLSLGLSSAFWSMDVLETFSSGEHRMTSVFNIHDYKYKYHLSSLSYGIRGNYHFSIKKRLDSYFGAGLGITKHVSTYQYYPDAPGIEEVGRKSFESGLGVHFATSLGMRYYLFPFLGLNLEVGYDTGAMFLGGIVFKLSTKKEHKE